MLRAVPDRVLDDILASVSRSFYLSLQILPRAIRSQLSGVYLVARAADTIADTHAVRAERRRELLADLRAALADEGRAHRLAADLRSEVMLAQPAPAESEQRLLFRFGESVALLSAQREPDRARTRVVLDRLVTSMERDLDRFPDERQLRALDTMAALDEHLFLAAGCVGVYFCEMAAAHVPALAHLAEPELVERGVHLGKALQLVNVIRDAAADLAAGRCYLPRELLAEHGLVPGDLVGPPERRALARPVIEELRRLAIDHIDRAWPLVMAIPRRAARLRLSAVWPLWIGLATLERIGRAPDPLDPAARVKVPRGAVYRLLGESVAAVKLDPVLSRRHWHRRALAARLPLAGRAGAAPKKVAPSPP